MKTSTTLLNITTTELKSFDEAYEIIENETVSSRNFNNLTIAGALFSLSTFDRSTFLSCVFYACKIENTVFKNCTFENCTFEFSNIYAATFIGCTFINCKWEFSHAKKTKIISSEIDPMTSSNLNKESSNELRDCYTTNPDLTQNSIDLVELYEKWLAA